MPSGYRLFVGSRFPQNGAQTFQVLFASLLLLPKVIAAALFSCSKIGLFLGWGGNFRLGTDLTSWARVDLRLEDCDG